MSMFSENRLRAIGVMSGTSMDGIDVALIETDGENFVKPLAHFHLSTPDVYEQLKRLAPPEKVLAGDVSEAEALVTDLHLKAVQKFFKPTDYELIGFHGQTVLHKPEIGFTKQLFDASLAMKLLQKPFVCDFRTNDMKQGGQGAPLVPIYHQALVSGLDLPVVFLNLGGVANITYIDAASLIACDTGPANALIDDFMRERLGLGFDENGALASKGKVHFNLVEKALAHEFFQKPPPKSLDRNAFNIDVSSLSHQDGAATLLAFSVESLARALKFMPQKPKEIYVCGGGRKNSFFMESLQKRFGFDVKSVEALGFNGDAIEAECFGYLAVRRFKNLPLSFPLTTGVKTPVTGGEIYGTI